MSQIFRKSTAVHGFLKTDTSDLKIADIAIHRGSAAVQQTLPIISISDFEHVTRNQVDCTLSGDLYILTAKGGLAGCTITFLDRIGTMGCGDSAKADSALKKYDEIRKNPSEYRIKIKIYSATNDTDVLASFTGVITSCSAELGYKQDTSYMYVTYKLLGVWDD